MSTGSEQGGKQTLYRSALETLSANIVIFDAAGSIVTSDSTSAESSASNEHHESPDWSGTDYLMAVEGVEESYARRAATGISAVIENERSQFELEYPRQSIDGPRWMLLQATPFVHDGERHVAVSHTEVTDRKQHESALREAYEISTAGSVSLSEKVEELLEVARSTIGTEYSTLSRVEDSQYLFDTVTSATDSEVEAGDWVPVTDLPPCQHVVNTEETLVAHDLEDERPELAGSDLGIESYLGAPVIVNGTVYGTFCFYSTETREEAFSEWAVTFVDLLSEWISHELEREEREEKLRHLKENVSDVVWMSSPENEEMEFISDSYRDVWGRSPDTLTENPTSFADGIHPADRERVQTALADQQTNPDDYEEVYRVVQPDGEVRWVHDQSAGVFVNGELQRIVGIATDITDRKEHEQELAYQSALLEAQAETMIDGLLVVDSDRSVRYHNERFLDVWGLSEESVVDYSDESLLELVSGHLADPDPFHKQVEYLYNHPKEESRDTIALTDDRWLDRYSAPVIGDDGTHYGRLWVFRDITEQKAREQALEHQRNDLLELERVNTLVRGTIQALQDTTAQEELETAVCEAFTESDLYQAAWIAEWTGTTMGDQRLSPQTAAGIDESYLDGISEYSGPAETALHTGTVQVVNDIATASEMPDERRAIALAHDHHTLAAVPIRKDETTYGVLVVYAPTDHTINSIEQDVLADLGQSIALAIQRVHSQRSLTAETVVSIDLRIPDSDFVFGAISTELDCKLSLEQRVAANDGSTIYYLHIEGAETTDVSERLEADSVIRACTVVRDGDDSRPDLVEAHLAENQQLPLDVLTDYGATMTSAQAVDGDITLRVELPSQVAVGNVLTAVREVAPSIEMMRKRHVDRPMTTATTMQNRITGQLTKKQEAALKAAYARGYYAWPRDSTVEEIAEAFEISAPTLHYRLRKAHDTVIGSVLNPQQVCE